MECPICYDTVSEDKYQKLECIHSLCKLCLSRLHQRACPFCREPISFSFIQMLLPTNNDDDNVTWNLDDMNSGDDYNFYELDIYTHIPRQRRMRRRRRSRQMILRDPGNTPIPNVVSEIDIIEILHGIKDTQNEQSSQCGSASDKQRQKIRHERNRWRRQQSHITAQHLNR